LAIHSTAPRGQRVREPPAIATIKLPQVHVVIAASSQPVQQAGWVVAALAVSFVSWIISRRAAG
jgi:hypothetical protein